MGTEPVLCVRSCVCLSVYHSFKYLEIASRFSQNLELTLGHYALS